MSKIDKLEKEYGISYMEFVKDTSLLCDNVEIAYYLEDGSADSFIDKIADKFRKLFESLKKFFSNLFTDKKAEAEVKKLEAMKREELEKMKVQHLDTHKMMAHSKKYKQKIMNAKSEDEIDKIMKEYRSGGKKLLLGAAITTVSGIALYSFWKNKQFKKYDAEAKKAYDEYMVAIQDLGYTQNRAKSHQATAQDMVEKGAVALEKQSKYANANIKALHCSAKAKDREYNRRYYQLRKKCDSLIELGSDIFNDIKVDSEWIQPDVKNIMRPEDAPKFVMGYPEAILTKMDGKI